MSSTRTAATSLTPISPPPWCWSCFATWWTRPRRGSSVQKPARDWRTFWILCCQGLGASALASGKTLWPWQCQIVHFLSANWCSTLVGSSCQPKKGHWGFARTYKSLTVFHSLPSENSTTPGYVFFLTVLCLCLASKNAFPNSVCDHGVLCQNCCRILDKIPATGSRACPFEQWLAKCRSQNFWCSCLVFVSEKSVS